MEVPCRDWSNQRRAEYYLDEPWSLTIVAAHRRCAAQAARYDAFPDGKCLASRHRWIECHRIDQIPRKCRHATEQACDYPVGLNELGCKTDFRFRLRPSSGLP